MSTQSRVPSIVMSACVLSLATCSLLYLPLGAVIELEGTTLIVIPALGGVSSAFLLWRFLAKPGSTSNAAWSWFAEACCWLMQLYFAAVVSQMRLASPMQQVCGTSLLFFVATIVWLPVVGWRRTSLEARVARLPRGISLSASFGLLVASAVLSGVLFILPDNFP